MKLILQLLIIPMALSQVVGVLRGKNSGIGSDASLTDAGIRIGGVTGLILSVFAFYLGSWILAIAAFVTQISVQSTVSEIQEKKLEVGVFIIRFVIIFALVAWYFYRSR